MRELLILTGPSGTGKSTFVDENNLKDFTLSLDTFRKLLVGNSIDKNGNNSFSIFTPKIVVEIFYSSLESRMDKGEFLVVDNTHLNQKDYNKYSELCKKHGYKAYYKTFKLDVESSYSNVISRKNNYVPKEAIEGMYNKLKSLVIPSFFKEIKDLKELNFFKGPILHDLKEYNIFVIGDIHGCYEELKKFIDLNYNLDDMYIFCGDYVDRGYNNSGVLKLLKKIYKNKNVVLLEGNHEKWLRLWGTNNEDSIKSLDFKNRTAIEFSEVEDSGVNKFKKSQARDFCNLLKTYSYIETIHGKVLITHGGVNFLEKDNNLCYSNFYIKGQGKYNDLNCLYDQGSSEANIIIHGHRNLENFKKTELISGNSLGGKTTYFNVEGSIESGGDLRYVYISKDKSKEPELKYIKSSFDYKENVNLLLDTLRARPKDITERICNVSNVSSFNFSKEVFFKRSWTSINCKARGLFIDTLNNQVCGRGYKKFFNKGEIEKTKDSNLKDLCYPLEAFEKFNGFLGILYVKDDQFVFNSKAGDFTDFAERFKEIFYKKVNSEDSIILKEFLKKNNLSCTFEVLIPERDNLSYFKNEDNLVLLDFIYNKVKFSKMNYKNFCSSFDYCFNNSPELIRKQLVEKLYSKKELDLFLEKNKSIKTEGFIIEDKSGFMFKWKAPLYCTLKLLRGYKSHNNRSNVFSNLIKYNILDNKKSGINVSKNSLKQVLDTLDSLDKFPSNLEFIQKIFLDKI